MLKAMSHEIPIEQLAAEVYDTAPAAVQERMVSQLVGKIYETAPVTVRSKLILHLMKPLGVLSLVAVADGIFANIRFRTGWPDVQVLPDDVKNVEPQDVVALTHYAQQVSLHCAGWAGPCGDGLSRRGHLGRCGPADPHPDAAKPRRSPHRAAQLIAAGRFSTGHWPPLEQPKQQLKCRKAQHDRAGPLRKRIDLPTCKQHAGESIQTSKP